GRRPCSRCDCGVPSSRISLPCDMESLHWATRAVKSSRRLAKASSRSSFQSAPAGLLSTLVATQGIYPPGHWFIHVNRSMISTSIGGRDNGVCSLLDESGSSEGSHRGRPGDRP